MTGWCPNNGEICKFDGYCCECNIKAKKIKEFAFYTAIRTTLG